MIESKEDLIRLVHPDYRSEDEESAPSPKGPFSVLPIVKSGDSEKFLNIGNSDLQKGKWKDASVYYLMCLQRDPEEERAYIGLLLAEMQVSREEDLANVGSRIKDSDYYKKACLYGGAEVEERLNACASGISTGQTSDPEQRYNSALERLQTATTSYDYKMLKKSFRNLGEYRDAAKRSEECDRLAKELEEQEYKDAIRNCKKGDVIRFGSHYWVVLSVEDRAATLLCFDIVAERTYSNSVPLKKRLFGIGAPKKVITWAESDLRKWLNEEFYATFSPEEQSQILKTGLKNPDNPDCGVKGGKKTTDFIYLLSLEEARAFGPSLLRYEIDKRPWWLHDLTPDKKEEVRRWWLRTPGKEGETPCIAYARYSGELFPEGEAYSYHLGVRPVMRIRI